MLATIQSNPLQWHPIAQNIQWVLNPIGYMEAAAHYAPDIFTARILGLNGRLVFVNHPQAIQEILTQDRKQFSVPGGLNRLLQPLLGDYSVIMLDGEPHRRQRQLLLPPFHGDRMRSYGQLIVDLTRQEGDRLPLNQPFTARPITQDISLQVMLQAVFGVRGGERYNQLRQLLAEITDLFERPIYFSFLVFPWLQRQWSPWGKFVRLRSQIDQLLYAEIAERRQKPDPERTDVLSLLLSSRDADGNGMTDLELRDEMITLLMAGHETTATAIAWALYWTHAIPRVKEQLLAELATLGADADPMAIFRLPYLSAVCNETLRIHPVAMLTFPRMVHQEMTLLGENLKPGTVLMGCLYLVHQRQDLYPEPKEFRPERFLERQFSPYEFIPFGGGARRCIGEALALFEMKLVLATFLSHYQLELADNQPEYPQRRGVTLAPARGVRMIRRNHHS